MTRGSIEQPGLRLRMNGEVRRISNQHRQLDAMFVQVVEALDGGSAPDTRAALLRFRDGFEAHTRLEDGFYFPALRGLRPELAEALEEFAAEHVRLLEAFGPLDARLDAPDLPGFAMLLERLAAEIADHEAREEALLAGQGGAPAA